MANPQANTPTTNNGAAQAPEQRAPQGQTPEAAAERISRIINPKAAADAPDGKAKAGATDKVPPKKAKGAKNTKAENQPIKKAKAKETGKAGQSDPAADDDVDDLAHDADQGETLDDTEAQDDAGQSDEEADADAAADEGDEGEADEGDEETYTVIVDGKEYEVSREELLNGYQRQADYTRKMQALASERKTLETEKESVKDLSEQRKTYQQGAESFQKNSALVLTALTRYMPPEPDAELASKDPVKFHQMKEARAEALHFQHAVSNELKQIEEKGRALHAQAVKARNVEIQKIMPEMADTAHRQKFYAYANSLGFTNEQIAQETNHVLFACVEKARKWDDLQARKALLKPKNPLPKATKRTNAEASAKAVQDRAKNDALASHRKSGTLKSAEAALAGILNRKK